MLKAQNEEGSYSILNRFISLIFLLCLSVLLIIIWRVENVKKEFIHSNLLSVAQNIDLHISRVLNVVEEKLNFIGDFISTRKIDKEYGDIFELFKISRVDKKDQIFSLGVVKWADSGGILRVDSGGVYSVPMDISDKLYMKEIKASSFTLHFNQEKKGSKSIIASLGVVDKDKKLGSIIAEIDLDKIDTYLHNKIKNLSLDYAIFNTSNNNAIIKSTEFNDSCPDKVKEEFKKLDLSEIKIRTYTTNKGVQLVYKLSSYPLVVVLCSAKQDSSYKDYFYSITPYKYELISILFIVIILIYLFYKSILDPFLELSDAALSISEGNVLTPIPHVSSKEGSLVAKALDKVRNSLRVEKELVLELSEVRNKLSITNLRLENKVAERTQDLERALANKTEFLNQLSHEIKIPLQGVTTIAENLVSYWGELTEVMKLEFSHQVAYSSKNILSLVNNLLDLSRFANGKEQLNLSRINFGELVLEIVEECKILYLYKKNITINFSNEEAVYIIADKDKITQLLRNLFVNAINHSRSNSYIAAKIIPTEFVTHNKNQEAIHFLIYDQGVGIKEEEIAVIFSSIYSDKYLDNMWLGLKVCYEIVKAHGGKIWAMNNKDGGATFNFILPIASSSEEENIFNYPTSIDISLNNPNILMIDDEENCLGTMELILHGTKYNLIKCNSGHLGLKYLEQYYQSISLIMLDLMMPDIYGLNVLSEIKNNPNTMRIPIILQTGSSDEEEIVKAFNMGASFFIRKPYQKSLVLNEIEKAMHLYDLNMKTLT